KMKRRYAVLVMAGVLLILGIPSSLGYGVWSAARPLGMALLDFFDYMGNSIITPIVAMISCIFIGWVVKPRVLSEEIAQDGKFARQRSFEFIVKWIAPLFIAAVLIGSFLEI
ncbi:MAG: sodium-dependent transporter, partial [Oscillospiraceae bacterium]|nr:sodium-dependent transporter [Oscillospiraceae bacterium]